ncbi:hypothetical protein [Nitrospirillum sp. BR 11163]|nr:hypothetical protein [Nitrospirillum sp. BR 11163]MEA1673968.1 hypothetical protein [Nitrospirillum sp. BR 11163]
MMPTDFDRRDIQQGVVDALAQHVDGLQQAADIHACQPFRRGLTFEE